MTRSYRNAKLRENVEVRLYAPHQPYRDWCYEEVPLESKDFEGRVEQINRLAEQNPDRKVVFVKSTVSGKTARLFLTNLA